MWRLGLRIQAFAIIEPSGRKSVALTSMSAINEGWMKPVASAEAYVYFNRQSGVFFSNRLRSTLIENEMAKLSPKGLKYSREQLET
jgi:hypothetical protein